VRRASVPVVLLSVARPDSEDVEVRRRYQLCLQLLAKSHASFRNPLGWKHDQIPTPLFFPEIAAAVRAVLERPAGTSGGAKGGIEETSHPAAAEMADDELGRVSTLSDSLRTVAAGERAPHH
jgi:hypothetical protein